MNYHFATFLQRLAAFFIDSIILYIGSIPFYYLLHDPTISFNQATLLPRAVITVIYNVFMIMHGGSTIGKRVLGIKVVSENGQPLTLMQAFLREFLGKSIFGVLIIGYLWMLFDQKKQCWQDKMGGTVVITSK